MNNIGQNVAAIAASIIGLATLAVIFSQKANTSSVISAAGTAFSGVIGAAVSPITGGSSSTSSITSALGSLGSSGDLGWA